MARRIIATWESPRTEHSSFFRVGLKFDIFTIDEIRVVELKNPNNTRVKVFDSKGNIIVSLPIQSCALVYGDVDG